MILNGKQTRSCSQFQKRSISMTIEEKRKQTILFISVLLLISPAAAQSGPAGNSSDQYKYPKFSPSMMIIIAILVAALFLMGFFSVYIRHCSDMAPGTTGRQLGGLAASMRRRAAARGLDREVIEAFPTFMYSEVKDLKIGKGALECAVCLNEFGDDETLRLIPKCDHVFHPECIDAWLDSHVTCPVCRANLVPQPGETGPQLPDLHSESDQPAGTQNDDVSVRVVEEEQEVPCPPQVMDRPQSFDQTRQSKSRSMRARLFGKFPRSHSTGHSLVQPGENTERFTLRLPVDVRKQVMKRALDRTTSCVVVLPSEGGSRRGYRARVGEGSSRGGRSYRRLDRVVKSDRWIFSGTPPFFSRTSSLKSPQIMGADGEGSTRSTTPRGLKTTVKLPSFKCLEPKGDETSLVSADSARCPV